MANIDMIEVPPAIFATDFDLFQTVSFELPRYRKDRKKSGASLRLTQERAFPHPSSDLRGHALVFHLHQRHLRCPKQAVASHLQIRIEFVLKEKRANKITVFRHLLNPPCSVGTSSAAKP